VGWRLVRRRQGHRPDAAPEALGRLELSLSRRSFVGGALTVGAPAALLGCGDDDVGLPVADGNPTGDVELLNEALALELGAVVLYEFGADEVEGAAGEVAQRFAAVEAEHVDALRAEIEALGGTPVEERSREEYERDFPFDRLREEENFLNFAVDLENTTLAAYIDAMFGLGDGGVRRTVLGIAGADAGQLSVVLGELGEPQVPDAFVVGAQPVK
jgi:rubrerythrin